MDIPLIIIFELLLIALIPVACGVMTIAFALVIGELLAAVFPTLLNKRWVGRSLGVFVSVIIIFLLGYLIFKDNLIGFGISSIIASASAVYLIIYRRKSTGVQKTRYGYAVRTKPLFLFWTLLASGIWLVILSILMGIYAGLRA